MADSKVVQFSEATSADPTEDALYLIINKDAVPEDRYIKPANLVHSIVGIPEDAGDFIGHGTGDVWEKKTLAETKTILGVLTKTLRGTVTNPQAVYAQAPQIVLIDSTEAAITITGICIKLNDSTPTAELAGDLKFADDQFDGSFANATVIDVCDTTSGVFSATSGFNDATVPSGKAVYYQMDASPHADIKRFTIKVTYTVD